MNKREHRALEKYVDEIAEILGLGEWQIGVSLDKPPTEGAVGEVKAPFGSRTAIVWFAEDLRDKTELWQKGTVVHELLHLARMQSQDRVESLEKHFPQPTFEVFRESYMHALEYEVDALAMALARYMPPIQWPEPK